MNAAQQSPLTPEQSTLFQELISTLTPVQLSWVSGYTAALSGGAAAPASATKNITILYGTESGNSEELADKLAKSAKKKGHKVALCNMSEFKPTELAKAETLLVVVSTWGEGDPPEAAEEFYATFMALKSDLSQLEYSVCALGDTSYDKFCQTGIDIDEKLKSLGAKSLAARVDCDVDFDASFAKWADSVWKNLGSSATSTPPAGVASAAPTEVFDKKNPFPSEILDNVLLSGANSAKETIHVEFSLEGSGLDYEPGDVLCVIPENAADTVAQILTLTKLDPNSEVELKLSGKTNLKDALKSKLDITGVSRKVAGNVKTAIGSAKLAALLEMDAKAEFKEWSYGRQIIDLLEIDAIPASLTAQQLVDCFRALPPRLYSIASSSKAHPDEVHLTVAAVRYQTHGKQRKGVASTFLADDAPKGSKALVYLHKNKNFRLPEDTNTPIIMVGPGTGIAPFRAFLEERAETEAKGESWLFFGDQCYNEDFLYQLELQDYLKSKQLSRLDLAFSRDQPEKIYVQHKMQQAAEELWSWLEKGAHFYVCGDASRMAKDVHSTLVDIISTHGKLSPEEAENYLKAMKKDKRYQRDVY